MGKRLGILTNNEDKRDAYLALIRRANVHQMETIVFSPKSVDFHRKQVHGWCWKPSGWVRIKTDYPDMIHDVGYYHKGGFTPLLRKLRKEIPFLSNGSGGKWTIQKHLLQIKGLRPYLLPTYLYKSHTQVIDLLNQHDALMIKPLNGKGGKGIWKITKMGDIYQVQPSSDGGERKNLQLADVSVFLKKTFRSGAYIIQKWVDTRYKEGKPTDIRVLVQKYGDGNWELNTMAARVGAKTGITSNIQGGGAALRLEEYLRLRFGEEKGNEVFEQLKKIARILPIGLERSYQKRFWEFGFDVGIDAAGQPWIFEVNIKPGHTIWRKMGRIDVIEKSIHNAIDFANFLLNGTRN